VYSRQLQKAQRFLAIAGFHDHGNLPFFCSPVGQDVNKTVVVWSSVSEEWSWIEELWALQEWLSKWPDAASHSCAGFQNRAHPKQVLPGCSAPETCNEALQPPQIPLANSMEFLFLNDLSIDTGYDRRTQAATSRLMVKRGGQSNLSAENSTWEMWIVRGPEETCIGCPEDLGALCFFASQPINSDQTFHGLV
jgi:hypothetical protein